MTMKPIIPPPIKEIHEGAETWHFEVDLPIRSQVYVGNACLSQCENWPVAVIPQPAMVFLDEAVHRLFPDVAQLLMQSLKKRGWDPHLRVIEASEQLKNFEVIYPLYGEMLAVGMRRQSLVVAVGGGTIGDAIGFLAATYLRGLKWVNVPTTLLGQVDSSLGGKTGVNHAEGKNLVGAIHQPHAILCDPSLLGDLPQRDRISGLGEMLKYGLIAKAEFWRELIQKQKAILAGEPAALSKAIAYSLAIKASYVEQDEHDLKGIRAALNFGHTFAHGIESAAGYGALRHGEAVIMGMYLAILLSLKEKVLAPQLAESWLKTLQDIPCFDIPEFVSNLDHEKMRKAMCNDKKNETRLIRVLLIKDYGALLPRDFSDKQLQYFLKNVR